MKSYTDHALAAACLAVKRELPHTSIDPEAHWTKSGWQRSRLWLDCIGSRTALTCVSVSRPFSKRP